MLSRPGLRFYVTILFQSAFHLEHHLQNTFNSRYVWFFRLLRSVLVSLENFPLQLLSVCKLWRKFSSWKQKRLATNFVVRLSLHRRRDCLLKKGRGSSPRSGRCPPLTKAIGRHSSLEWTPLGATINPSSRLPCLAARSEHVKGKG